MIASATSSGLPRRRNGIALVSASLTLSGTAAINGVSVGPGQTQLTLILYRAVSRASDFVKAIRPPLAPEYTVSPRLPTRPASLATLTMLPLARSIMPGSSALASDIGPMKLSATSLFQNSGVPSMNGADRFRGGHVDRHERGPVAFAANGGGAGLAAGGVDVGDDDVGTGPGQPLGSGLADAGAGAGDDGGLVGEFHEVSL